MTCNIITGILPKNVIHLTENKVFYEYLYAVQVSYE